MKLTLSNLKVRDLILIGVLTTVMVIVEIVVGALLLPIMWLALLLGAAITAVFMTPIYLLMAFKVNKRGVFLLMSVLRGLFYTLMGWPTMFIIMLPAGLIGELLMSPPETYRSIRRNSLAWMVYTAIYSLHSAILVWVFGIQYISNSGQYSPEQIAFISTHYFNPLTVLAIVVLSIAGAGLGCWLGWRILKKHFIKSGLVQASS